MMSFRDSNLPQLLIMSRTEKIWSNFLEHRKKKHVETDQALKFHPTQNIWYELDNLLVPVVKDN